MAEERAHECSEAATVAGLPPVHPGDVLQEEFLGLSTTDLAERLGVPLRRLAALVRRAGSVTADDALRLSRFFNATPEFWLNLQAQHDLEVARAEISPELEAIEPLAGEEGP